MPNRPGFGIFGWPRELSDDNARGIHDAEKVYAVKAGTTVFAPATAVYQWCHNAWELMWTPLTNPVTNVTATYALTEVTVSWTEPALNTASHYLVRRADGTPVTPRDSTIAQGVHIPIGTTSIVDDGPVPSFYTGSGVYTVEAINAADYVSADSNSGPVAAPLLSIDLHPSAATATLVGGSTVQIAWTTTTTKEPDSWWIFDKTAGSYLINLPANARTYQLQQTPGTVHVYTVYPMLSGKVDVGTVTNSVDVPPDPPINLSITPIINELVINFAYPGHGNIARYEVQVNDTLNGAGWVNLDLFNTSGAAAWITETSTGYMRVRSISATGLASSYAQVGPAASLVPAPQILLYAPHSGQSWNDFNVNVTYGTYQPQFCAEYYWANFPQYGWQTGGFVSGGPSCVVGDNVGATHTWVISKLQNTPTYARVKAVRNGVSSAYNQVGPI